MIGKVFRIFREKGGILKTLDLWDWYEGLDVIKYLDEGYKLDYCALRPGRCEEWQISPCAVHDKWTKLRQEILEYLSTTTVAELAEVEEKHRKPVNSAKL